MRDYKKYEVWQNAHELVLFVYKQVLPAFPLTEQFDLVRQLKRAAYSIPFNIVEGCGRNSDDDFARFLDMSLGSAHELEYCFLLGKDLGYIKEEEFRIIHRKISEIKARLINLIKSIRGSK
jgi:four helix bundle protein